MNTELPYFNEIVCGESCEVLSKLPNDCIDLTITSPPYDNIRNYHGYVFDFECIASELLRVTKPGGVVIWVVADATKNGSESGTSFVQALHFMNIGFNLHDTMIYAKNNYVPLNHNRYEQCWEYMFCFSKGKPRVFNPIKVKCKHAGESTKNRTFYQTATENTPSKGHKNETVAEEKIAPNIFYYTTGGSKETKGHPAIFPEKLVEDQMLTWSIEDDLILDPFSGSGTTCKIALLNKRNYIGIDISDTFCKLAIERLKVISPLF